MDHFIYVDVDINNRKDKNEMPFWLVVIRHTTICQTFWKLPRLALMAILNYLKHFVQRGKCFGTKQIKFISPAKKKKLSLFFGNLKSDWILNLISRFEKKN